MGEEKDLVNATKIEDLPAKDLLSVSQEDPNKLLTNLINTNDASEIDNMVPVFNSFFKKREIMQKHTEYDLKDKLLERMLERLDKTPDNFNNSDLAVWMKTIQQAIDSSQKNIDQQQSVTPTQTVNYQQNNNVHVSIADTLSRESRSRITDAIQKILQNVQNEENSSVCLDEPSDLTELEEFDNKETISEDKK